MTLQEVRIELRDEGPFGKTIVFLDKVTLAIGDELVIKHDGNCEIEFVSIRRKEQGDSYDKTTQNN